MKAVPLVLVFFQCLYNGNAQAQQVGVNTNTIHSSAVLQVESSDKGFLLPRLTTAARLAIDVANPTPATSLIVFDTDTRSFWYYNSAAWIELKDSYKNEDLGVITAFHGTPPAGWLPLNGSSVSASAYPGLAAKYAGWVSGANIVLPDYRGYFLRGAGTNADGVAGAATPGTKQQQLTARSVAAMTTSSNGAHTHTGSFTSNGAHSHTYWDGNAGGAWHHSGTGTTNSATRNNVDVSRTTGTAGAHTHTFNTTSAANHSHSITGGGDTETKPSNITVIWAVKAR